MTVACSWHHRARNLIERFFNKIKQCRRVATRYDKPAADYLAFVKLASIRIWLRANESTAWSGLLQLPRRPERLCRFAVLLPETESSRGADSRSPLSRLGPTIAPMVSVAAISEQHR